MFLIVVTFSLLLAGPALAAPEPVDEPPLVGQPDGFSGAVGQFRIDTVAEPTELKADEWLRFRLRITSVGPAVRPPARPDLRKLPKFQSAFQIEDLVDQDRTTDVSSGRLWEYVYRLRPRSPAVEAIPPVRFVYFTPGRAPHGKGYYQTTYTHTIPISVQPREVPAAAEFPLPAGVYRLAEGPEVLRRDAPEAPPPAWLVGLLAGAPPLACAGWYLAWRQLYPDAARAARRRRSQAARAALYTLRAGRLEDCDAQARRAAAALTTYLGQRFDLAPADATPPETAERLRRLGLSEATSAQAAELLRACDAVRYGQDARAAQSNLTALAAIIILNLESEPCHSPVS